MGIRIVLADADAATRESFALRLADEPDFTVIGQAGDGVEAVQMIRELSPDVAIFEVNLPKLDGVSAIRRSLKINAGVRHLVLSSGCSQESITAALRAGACAWVLKDDPPDRLPAAIREVVEGGSYISPILFPTRAARSEPRPEPRPERLAIPPPWMIGRK